MSNVIESYIDESQRLNLCRGLAGLWIPLQVAVERNVPLESIHGPVGLATVNVKALQQARDVSTN